MWHWCVPTDRRKFIRYNRDLIQEIIESILPLPRIEGYHLSFRTQVRLKRSQSRTVRSAIRLCGFWLTALLLVAPFGQASESAASPPREYRLRFYHTHTHERLDIVYRRGDTYLPLALDELDHYLRDHRTGEVHHFDPRLFDLLHDLTASLNDSSGEIDVICGYRTPWSNEFLRTRSPNTGVARHSLHMQAEAIDIRLPGIATATVRDAALRLHRGGVGYYRTSDFVHVDVGRVRRW
jgi:uncharacterized protein YcbK (DUF882 family)